LLTTQHLEEAEKLADRIAILRQRARSQECWPGLAVAGIPVLFTLASTWVAMLEGLAASRPTTEQPRSPTHSLSFVS
jgi:hypothetical protein